MEFKAELLVIFLMLIPRSTELVVELPSGDDSTSLSGTIISKSTVSGPEDEERYVDEYGSCLSGDCTGVLEHNKDRNCWSP